MDRSGGQLPGSDSLGDLGNVRPILGTRKGDLEVTRMGINIAGRYPVWGGVGLKHQLSSHKRLLEHLSGMV